MKKILVLTDFSDSAKFASDYAIQLAKMNDAEIHFFHLQFTPVDWVRLPKDKEKRFPEILKAIGRAKFKLGKWVFKAKTQGIKSEKILVFGSGNAEILHHLKSHDYDLLVMGAHGMKGVQEEILGSNAQTMLRNSDAPVLIIKKPVLSSINKILFISDFTDVSKDSFHTLTHFADVLNAHIDLLFVNTPKQFKESVETSKNMDDVMKHCNRAESCKRNIINAASVEDGVRDFILQNPMDLIAICTHGKSGFQQLFSPSIAEKIANHTTLPLLSIKL